MKTHYLFLLLSLFTAAVLSAPAQSVGKFPKQAFSIGFGLWLRNNLGARYAEEAEFVDTVEIDRTW